MYEDLDFHIWRSRFPDFHLAASIQLQVLMRKYDGSIARKQIVIHLKLIYTVSNFSLTFEGLM